MRSRARGSGTDVDDVGPLVEEPPSVVEHSVGGVVASAVIEGVGGDVEYAHDDRPMESDEASADSDSERVKVHVTNNAFRQSLLCWKYFFMFYTIKKKGGRFILIIING